MKLTIVLTVLTISVLYGPEAYSIKEGSPPDHFKTGEFNTSRKTLENFDASDEIKVDECPIEECPDGKSVIVNGIKTPKIALCLKAPWFTLCAEPGWVDKPVTESPVTRPPGGPYPGPSVPLPPGPQQMPGWPPAPQAPGPSVPVPPGPQQMPGWPPAPQAPGPSVPVPPGPQQMPGWPPAPQAPCFKPPCCYTCYPQG